MRILDENNIEIKNPDLSKGYLKQDSLFICHHDAIEGVAEVGHHEIAREYPNGGRDAKWVVDVPAVEAKDAYDEFEEIQRYIPFTEAQLAVRRISELKRFLQETDYNILKIVEGAMTLQDGAEVIAKRASWRKEINELEVIANQNEE